MLLPAPSRPLFRPPLKVTSTHASSKLLLLPWPVSLPTIAFDLTSDLRLSQACVAFGPPPIGETTEEEEEEDAGIALGEGGREGVVGWRRRRRQGPPRPVPPSFAFPCGVEPVVSVPAPHHTISTNPGKNQTKLWPLALKLVLPTHCYEVEGWLPHQDHRRQAEGREEEVE